jgi:hypothetical protein
MLNKKNIITSKQARQYNTIFIIRSITVEMNSPSESAMSCLVATIARGNPFPVK